MGTLLKRVSTAEAVVDYIKNEIKTGGLAKGEQLPSERELQKAFGVSRFSLREGLARLSALGIIKIFHGKGAFVSTEIDSVSLGDVLLPLLADMDEQSMENLFEARILLEGKVAALAAERRTASDLSELRDILSRSESLPGDPAEFGFLDHEFHRKIARAAGNVFFIKMLEVLDGAVDSFLYDHAKDAPNRDKAVRSHWEILRSIEKKDPDSTAKIMRRHISGCRRNYEKQVFRTLREKSGN